MPASHYDPSSPGEQPVALPAAPRVTLASNAILQPPLSRRGHGPGLILLLPPPNSYKVAHRASKPLDPEPVQKWAEEGFAVVGITTSVGTGWSGNDALTKAFAALVKRADVDIKDKVGVIVYDPLLEYVPTALPHVACAITYGTCSSSNPVPVLSHIPNPGKDPHTTPTAKCHVYSTSSRFFVFPDAEDYHGSSATVSHTRSLVFLRKHLGGPHFDLEAIWDEHTVFEFEERSVAKTMGTMVAEPYVNHVPTMTGGMGREKLTAFYRDHFIFSNPADTAMEPISRTVGADRIIDEFILTMTHDKVVDWLLPGVPPSGKKLAIPMMSVVCVRGDRLYNEHIWWDQATALLQADIIPTHVPYPIPDGKGTLRLPIIGSESAKLLADETADESNKMFGDDWGVSNV